MVVRQNPLDSNAEKRKTESLMRPLELRAKSTFKRIFVAVFLSATLSIVAAAPGYGAKSDLVPVRTALAARDYDKALAILQPLISSGDESGEASYLLGEIYLAKGQAAEAEKALGEAVNKKRYTEPEALLAYANSLIAVNRPAEVAPLLEKPLSKTRDPKKAAPYKHALGLAEMALGNYSKAQEWLLGARVDDEDNLQYREALGDAYYKGQIFPLAIPEYEAVLAADSSRVDLLFKIAQTLYQQKRLNEARPLLVDVLKRDSTYNDAYFLLANIYMISAQSRTGGDPATLYKAALSLYRKAREVSPTVNPVLVAKNIATVYYLLNAYDSAIVEIQNAIDTGAKDPELLLYLGRSSVFLGNYQKAVEAFTSYRQARDAEQPQYQWSKSDAEVFWRTAECLEALKDTALLSQIAENYRRAVELDPDNDRSIGALAITLQKLGQYTEAAVEFQKLVQKNSGDARTLFNASLPYLQTDNNDKAVDLLMQAAAADTTADNTYRSKAYKLAGPRLIKLGRTADAQKAYQWLVDHEPGNCENLQWLGYALFSQKRYAEAVAPLRRAYQCFESKAAGGCPQNELRWWLAFAIYDGAKADKEKDEAYKLCQLVVKCDPKQKDAKGLMDRIDEEIEETGQAKQ